ncbi:hypothetical protein [Microbacterium paludicola]|uniref:DUF4190 domain-containing protein n=1 Tax=Microbacterium paludicola TaxID=300019 RepID=UPI0031D5B123
MSLPPNDGNVPPVPPVPPTPPTPAAPDYTSADYTPPAYTPPTYTPPQYNAPGSSEPTPEQPEATAAQEPAAQEPATPEQPAAPQEPDATVPPAPAEPTYAAPAEPTYSAPGAPAFPGAQAPYSPPAPGQGYPQSSVPPYAQPTPPAQGYPGAPGGSGGAGTPYGGVPYNGAPMAPPAPGKGLAITGLVLGILGFLGALIPFGIFGAGLLLLAALVIGIIVLVKKKPGKGMGLTAVILGGLGLIAGIAITVAVSSFIADQVRNAPNGILEQACDDAGLTQEECDEIYGQGDGPATDPGIDEGGTTDGEDGAGVVAGSVEFGETAFGTRGPDDDYYWFTVEVTNADEANALENFYASVEAVDADGTILDSSSIGGMLLPGTTIYTGIFSQIGDNEIAKLDVLPEEGFGSEQVEMSGAFAVEGLEAVTDEYSTTVTGTITSTFAEDHDSLDLTLIARDASGKIVLADQGYTDRVPAGGSANFEIYLIDPMPEGITYEVYPHIW